MSVVRMLCLWVLCASPWGSLDRRSAPRVLLGKSGWDWSEWECVPRVIRRCVPRVGRGPYKEYFLIFNKFFIILISVILKLGMCRLGTPRRMQLNLTPRLEKCNPSNTTPLYILCFSTLSLDHRLSHAKRTHIFQKFTCNIPLYKIRTHKKYNPRITKNIASK